MDTSLFRCMWYFDTEYMCSPVYYSQKVNKPGYENMTCIDWWKSTEQARVAHNHIVNYSKTIKIVEFLLCISFMVWYLLSSVNDLNHTTACTTAINAHVQRTGLTSYPRHTWSYYCIITTNRIDSVSYHISSLLKFVPIWRSPVPWWITARSCGAKRHRVRSTHGRWTVL